jgi:hypothetical protein
MTDITLVGGASADAPPDTPVFRQAFKLELPLIRAVPTVTLRQVSVEPVAALHALHKSLPKIRLLLPRLKEVFNAFDPTCVDRVLSLGNAFAYTTTLLRLAEPRGDGFEALAAECSEVRAKYDAYVRAAIAAGVIQTSRMDELKGAGSYRNLGHDLMLLAELLHSNWSKIESKCFFTKADVDHAEVLANRLNVAVGERESRPGAYDEANLDRQRAFTLFFNAYNKLREEVGFVLKRDGLEHTLEDVMPSLNHLRTGTKKRNGKPEEEEEEELPEPELSAGPTPPQASSPSSRIGMPDSDPFTS